MTGPNPPIATVGALPLIALGWFGSDDEPASSVRDALEDVQLGSAADALDEPLELDDVYAVGTNRDDDSIYVPVVEADLGTAAEPDRDAAYAIAAAVVAALHPVLDDVHVRQYDLVFAHGERSWYATTDQSRISVTTELAERLARERSFEAPALRREIETADDGDDLLPPVSWGEPLPHSYYQGSSDAWMAAMGGGAFY